jgi:hypothetical protein
MNKERLYEKLEDYKRASGKVRRSDKNSNGR